MNRVLTFTLMLTLSCGGLSTIIDAEESPRHSLTPETAHRICQDIMDLANTGQLQERFERFSPPLKSENLGSVRLADGSQIDGVFAIDYNKDGATDRLVETIDGGSCGAFHIVALDADKEGLSTYGKSPPGNTSDDDENLRWASWGRKDRLVILDGEPIVVTSRDWQTHANIASASWMGNGVQQPLCTFEFSGTVKNSQIPIGDRPICAALLAEDVEAPAWTEPRNLDEQVWRSLSHDYGLNVDPSARFASVDLDQDGAIESIAQLVYESGAGCGSHHEWYMAFTQDHAYIMASPLNRNLAHREWGAFYMNRRIETAPLSPLFVHEGKAYLLGTAPSGHAGIYSFENGELQLRCEIDRIAQVRILQEYSTGP
ncbi:hypothetical protein [Hypericibacter sp.]|uniref:hypothetical protein n=1 Tax=Hypericibacter sp. TaxID=2705401 RepID=UPI003D6C7EF5